LGRLVWDCGGHWWGRTWRTGLAEAKQTFEYTRPRLPADYFELMKGVQWVLVKGDTEIDKNLLLNFTPGHSHGGQSVNVKTTQGLAVIGGIDSVQENFDPLRR
jgi:hypothetical protein